MKYSLTYTGIIVMVAGTWLVNSLGLTDSCATELTSKATEYAPLLVGAVMALIGRNRAGGISTLGVKE